MSTDLAKAWEKDDAVRAAARKLSAVFTQGQLVTRDALVNNEECLIHAINHLGSRVSVDVLDLHLGALYSFMEIPIDSGVRHTQAWYLRRCMTLYNDIVRKPHLPREMGIRRIMSGTGIDLSLYGPSSLEAIEEEEPLVLEAGSEEDGEEEQEFEADPCCEEIGQDSGPLASSSDGHGPSVPKKDQPPLPDDLPGGFQDEIFKEAEAEEAAAQFYAFDQDADADTQFLQFHALAAIKKDLARQPGAEELAETMDNLERLNAELIRKAKEAKLAGTRLCSDEEAQAIQRAYVNVLRAARQAMKFADETGLSSISELWDKANTMIWRKKQEGQHTSWWGWIVCPFSRWHYVEARNAFERFTKWGTSPLLENMPDASKLLMFNAPKFASSGLFMHLRSLRRSALQQFTGANWFERWWNPSYRIHLGNSFSRDALEKWSKLSENAIQQILQMQILQDRANTEHLRSWQEKMTALQFVLIGLSIVIAIIGFFTGNVALAVLALVAALVQLVLAVKTKNLEDRTDLTMEAKQQLSNIYSVVMSLVGLLHLGLSCAWTQVANQVAKLLKELVNCLRTLQAMLASPFLVQALSRLTTFFQDHLLTQGDGTFWGSLAAGLAAVMDLISFFGNFFGLLAALQEEEIATQRRGRRSNRRNEDGGHDDAEHPHENAADHDDRSTRNWTIGGVLTALGTMLRNLLREKTRTGQASNTEREPRKEELNSADRTQDVTRRDLKVDDETVASLIEEHFKLQVPSNNGKGSTITMEENGQKVLQMENGQFVYAGQKIGAMLQQEILMKRGFEENVDFYVSNGRCQLDENEPEVEEVQGDAQNHASWNKFVSLLLALEKQPEPNRAKLAREVMEKASEKAFFSQAERPNSKEVVSKRTASYSVKADDQQPSMKVERFDDLELTSDGSILRLRMTEDEIASEAGATAIQVNNANLKVSSERVESSGTCPKENAKMLFTMLQNDADAWCLDTEAVEEMVNSLPEEVNLEQMAEALHNAEAKAQPTLGQQQTSQEKSSFWKRWGRKSTQETPAKSEDQNAQRTETSKREAVASFVEKVRNLMKKSETMESNLEIDAVMKLANKLPFGNKIDEQLRQVLVEGKVHIIPKELADQDLQFNVDGQEDSLYRSIMYLLLRQQGHGQGEAKERVESSDKAKLLKHFLGSFLPENRVDNMPAARESTSKPTTLQQLEEKLKERGLEIEYGLAEGIESTLQDLIDDDNIEGLDKLLKDFLDGGQDVANDHPDLKVLVNEVLKAQQAGLQQHVEKLKESIRSGEPDAAMAAQQAVLDDMKRYVRSAKAVDQVGQKPQSVRWWIQQIYELLRSPLSSCKWAMERAIAVVAQGVDYREISNIMANFGFQEGVDYKMIEQQGAYHMYPIEAGDTLQMHGEDNFCMQRTLAFLLKRKEDPNLSVQDIKNKLASDTNELMKVNKLLADFGVFQTRDDLDLFAVGNRPDFHQGVRDLMKAIAKSLGYEKFHICHGLAWKTISAEIDTWLNLDAETFVKSIEKIDQWVEGFTRPNSLLDELMEQERKAQGDAEKKEISQIREKFQKTLSRRQEKIQRLWDQVKREKREGTLKAKSVRALKLRLNDYVGNLRPGEPNDNVSIGAKNDLTTDQDGYLTSRSEWVDDVNGGPENYRIVTEGVKSSQKKRRFIILKRIPSLVWKEVVVRKFRRVAKAAGVAEDMFWAIMNPLNQLVGWGCES